MRSQAVSNASYALQLAAMELTKEDSINVLELGSGCGIVSLMLALQRPLWQITGIEIQAELQELSANNALLCGANTQFVQADLRTYCSPKPFDLILSNPPWQKVDSGRYSHYQSRNISRFELLCTLKDVLDCIQRNMSNDGDALLLYPLNRLEDIKSACAKTLLDIISLSPVTALSEHVMCHIRHRGNT